MASPIQNGFKIESEVHYTNRTGKHRWTSLFINEQKVFVDAIPMDICAWSEEELQVKQRVNLIKALKKDLEDNYNVDFASLNLD